MRAAAMIRMILAGMPMSSEVISAKLSLPVMS
jgi:hypothetical protein